MTHRKNLRKMFRPRDLVLAALLIAQTAIAQGPKWTALITFAAECGIVGVPPIVALGIAPSKAKHEPNLTEP